MNPVVIATAAKFLVSTASSIGAGTVVSNVANATLPAAAGTAMKVSTAIGSYAIGSLIGSQVSDHMGAKIQNVIDKMNEIKDTSANK